MLYNYTDGGFKMVDIESFNKVKDDMYWKNYFICWKFSVPFAADSKSS